MEKVGIIPRAIKYKIVNYRSLLCSYEFYKIVSHTPTTIRLREQRLVVNR